MRILLTLVLLCSMLSANCQLIGNYTIGGVSPDYSDILSAVNDLNAIGVSGDVNFKLRPGTYNEKIDLAGITGASASSVVTFESESGDTSSVWWVSGSTNISDNYIMRSSGASHVTIKNITFRNNGPYGSVAILLEGGSSNISMIGNHLMALTSTYINLDRHTLIKSSNSSDSNITIADNSIEKGGYGIKLSGLNATERDSTISIVGNIISSPYGIYLTHVENLLLSYNKIDSWNETVILTSFGNPIAIDHNTLKSTFEHALLIESNSNNDPGVNGTRILNNLLKARKSGVDVASDNLDLINNTCYSVDGGYGAANIKSDANLTNNIFYSLSNMALRISSASYNVVSNYNLYSTATNYAAVVLRNGSVNYFSLNDWQQASGQDQNSYFGAVQFVSANDLHIINAAGAYNNAILNPWITDDNDSELRGAFPDIGADEFTQPTTDVTISKEYIVDTGYVCAGMLSISVKIINSGTDVLNTATLELEINGVTELPVIWSGSLSFLDTSDFIVLNYNLPQNSSLNFRVWVSQPNGLIDSFTIPDTLVLDETLETRMQGTYTIGDLTLDYLTIQDAVDDLNLRGTCNNVEFLLADGIYYEGIELNDIDRETDFDTLFINSISENPDSVKWTQSGTDRPLTIYKTSNVYISNIAMEMDSGSSWDFEIVYIRYSNLSHGPLYNFCFDNCKFSSTNGWNDGLRIFANNVKVINSQFNGLENAIIMDNNGYQYTGYIIENNHFNNQLMIGLQLSKVDNIYIENNQFNNDFSTYTGTFTNPIYISSAAGDFVFKNNETSGFYNSLLSIEFQGTPANRGKIYNNFFSAKLKDPNGGGSLFAFDSDYLNFYHNSVNLGNIPPLSGTPDPLFAVISIVDFANHIGNEIYNNTIKADSVYRVFYGFNNSLADYNNIFIPNIINAYEFPPSTNHQNSITVDPTYYSFAQLYPVTNALEGMGIDLGLTIDIDSNLRFSPPTIGAVETWLYTFDLIIDSLYTVAHCDSFDLYCSVGNMALGQIDSVLLILNLGVTNIDSLNVVTNFAISNPMDSIYIGSYPIQFIQSDIYTLEAHIFNNNDEFPVNNFMELLVQFDTIQPIYLGGSMSVCYGEDNVITLDSMDYVIPSIWNGVTNNSYTHSLINGTNTIEIYDQNGCLHLDTVFISEFPLPQIDLGQNVLLCNYDQLVLNSVGGMTDYIWSNSETTPSILIDGATLGNGNFNYSVTVTDFNGCSNSDTILITIESCLGVDNLQNENKLQLYPNPSSGQFTLSISDNHINKFEVWIFDATGREMLYTEFMDNTIHFSLDVSPGLYFIHVSANLNNNVIPLNIY